MKIKSKWIKDLNVMHRSIKLLQDSRRNLDVSLFVRKTLRPDCFDCDDAFSHSLRGVPGGSEEAGALGW